MTKHAPKTQQFFMTAPSPCPYLDGHFERKVFTYLSGAYADGMNGVLTLGGFRRSQNIVYRPVCEECRACVSVRILTREFVPDNTMKRIYKINTDIVSEVIAPEATAEQYGLFRTYLNHRHADGGMAGMTMSDYSMMVADSPVHTRLVEYRLAYSGQKKTSENKKGQLLAVALTDILPDGYSMVYSFYYPGKSKRSLGTFMILDHIRRSYENGLPYVYLGYWVAGSRKMQYKIRFKPQEHLGHKGWSIYE